jgi:hypothetical protein
MGQRKSTGFGFYENGWTSCMWTGSSLIYGSWLELNTINKGPLGSIVM